MEKGAEVLQRKTWSGPFWAGMRQLVGLSLEQRVHCVAELMRRHPEVAQQLLWVEAPAGEVVWRSQVRGRVHHL